MIEVTRDAQGNITAVVEYLIFDNNGQLHDEGNQIFIGEVEINPEHRRKQILRTFIKTILNKYPKLERCCFCRFLKYPKDKYPDRRDVRFYTRKHFELLTKE